ncbi:hypothetical protein DFH09DRAFT_1125064 [Mycena vulgaris]|nr:hypothetical protein DFH09DRAFT_1125064 [Mycena vulgaris]
MHCFSTPGVSPSYSFTRRYSLREVSLMLWNGLPPGVMILARPPLPNIRPEADAQTLREEEAALLNLGALYRDQLKTEGLARVSTLSIKWALLFHTLQSKGYRGVGNATKAKAALTSARTSGASIYTPPPLPAALDIQSGRRHLPRGELQDRVNCSYLFEAFEAQAPPPRSSRPRRPLRIPIILTRL